MLWRVGMVTMLGLLCLCLGVVQAAGASGTGKQGLHGQPWAFGVSQSRKDALWQRSVNAHDMQQGAMTDSKPNADAVVDRPEQKFGTGKKDSIGLSWDRRESGWHSKPTPAKPDEHLPVQSEHRVRAFANVPAGDGLDIRVGPEVIVKDGKETPYSGKRTEDSRSSVGMGMQFKLDF